VWTETEARQEFTWTNSKPADEIRKQDIISPAILCFQFSHTNLIRACPILLPGKVTASWIILQEPSAHRNMGFADRDFKRLEQ
jgi:hypothetical protein